MRYSVCAILLVACGSSSTKHQEIGPEQLPSLDGGNAVVVPTEQQPSKPGENTSGTRLHLRNMVGTDGSKQFLGMYDTERKENCFFLTASDGHTRCLPTGLSYAGLDYYVESTCTRRAAIASMCTSGVPKYAVYNTQSACGALSTQIFQLSVQYTGQVYEGSPGSCRPVTVPNINGVYEILGEIPPTSFVEASEQVE